MKYLFLAILLLSFPAVASEKEPGGGNTVGNGGDTLALEFSGALGTAWAHVKNSAAYADLRQIELGQALPLLKIVTVDTPLESKLGEVSQESAAINLPENQLILVNRARWLAIQSPRVKEALALHEALSLIGKEGTGNYRYSGAYLAEFGIQAGEVEQRFPFVKNTASYETKDGKITVEAVARFLPKRQFFDDILITYSVSLNGKPMQSESRNSNELLTCVYAEYGDPDAIPKKFLRVAEAEGKPFGFLITGLGICGNTTSFRSLLIVPGSLGFYVQDFIHKTDPVLRLKDGRPELWYLRQVWGDCGTAGSFFVPDVFTVDENGWLVRGKFPSELTDIPQFNSKYVSYQPYPSFYLAGLRRGRRDLMDIAASYAAKDPEDLANLNSCGLPATVEEIYEQGAAIEKLKLPLRLFFTQ